MSVFDDAPDIHDFPELNFEQFNSDLVNIPSSELGNSEVSSIRDDIPMPTEPVLFEECPASPEPDQDQYEYEYVSDDSSELNRPVYSDISD